MDLLDAHLGGENKMATDPAESGSPEAVALRLLEIIAANERKILSNSTAAAANADRKWVLDTYAECLRVVRNPGGSSGPVETTDVSALEIIKSRLAAIRERNPEGDAPPSGDVA
jgi:hypothetical protein